ncbi:RagB/SusD family nutrient uptake outer membrane protein [Winogradskyella thalassocola]|uniref:SusD family protein n=1 Tax=Winogradskyella thalassocola TaxID=262004 RepID=A0A1G8KAQ8_9FLAO|nr:RagB/SusD family nutrient uptake outer membrane protein [Winogradskyella thalassocola]SDI40518.1 SusD family protein [Winogradskyella thalassocola]
MKRSIVCLIAFASLSIMGCGEDFLDPVRNTNVITSEDFAEFSEQNPELIEGTLDGIASFMIQDQGILAGQHYDLGQKGVDIWLDMLTGDLSLATSSYGWYNGTANLVATVDFTATENRIIWDYYYKVVNLSNSVIASAGGNDANPEGAEVRRILGQAKASRAYAYFYLTQIFQREYDPAQPILPYYDGDVANAAKVPASEIYALIVSDLTDAIDLLDGYTRELKNQIDKPIAQGLLAYTYAAMGNYADAKIQADAVINSGYPLTTAGQLAFPGAGSGFNDVNTASWMWGFDLTEDLGHQLIDWWGQMDYFTYSYAWAGDSKSIDNGLYAQIPANDIRKTQFGTANAPLMPINKFFDPGRAAGGQYIITTDLIFMRVEEFYLLSAEAAAKTGNEGAAKATMIELLSNRLGSSEANAYISPLSGSALTNAIYLQTRIELWGEGKAYFALKRNQKSVTRGSNHVFRAGETFLANSDEMSFQIPQNEIDNNPSISEQN